MRYLSAAARPLHLALSSTQQYLLSPEQVITIHFVDAFRHGSSPQTYCMMSSLSYGKKTYGSRAKSHRSLTISDIILVLVCLFTIYGFCTGMNRRHSNVEQTVSATTGTGNAVMDSESRSRPTIHSLDDLTPEELHPKATSRRYIVSPPEDLKPVSLVTCETTVGYLHIVVQ